jgi:DNA-binding LacI/PurR family transcriptional regulator
LDIHRETLGRLAADALHELSSTVSPQGKEYRIGSELVIGDSTGPAPESPAVAPPAGCADA